MIIAQLSPKLENQQFNGRTVQSMSRGITRTTSVTNRLQDQDRCISMKKGERDLKMGKIIEATGDKTEFTAMTEATGREVIVATAENILANSAMDPVSVISCNRTMK